MRKPKTARIEALWLEATKRFYWTVDDLMRHTGLSRRRIQMGLKAAIDDPLDFKTLWDIEWVSNSNAFVSAAQCKWHGGPGVKIPEELPVGCLFCMEAGMTAMIQRHGKPIEALKPSQDQPQGTPVFQPNVKTKKSRSAPKPSGCSGSPA